MILPLLCVSVALLATTMVTSSYRNRTLGQQGSGRTAYDRDIQHTSNSFTGDGLRASFAWGDRPVPRPPTDLDWPPNRSSWNHPGSLRTINTDAATPDNLAWSHPNREPTGNCKSENSLAHPNSKEDVPLKQQHTRDYVPRPPTDLDWSPNRSSWNHPGSLRTINTDAATPDNLAWSHPNREPTGNCKSENSLAHPNSKEDVPLKQQNTRDHVPRPSAAPSSTRTLGLGSGGLAVDGGLSKLRQQTPEEQQAIICLADCIRAQGSWNNIATDIMPYMLTELPSWPQNKYLTIELGNPTNPQITNYSKDNITTGKTPVTLQLSSRHYSPKINNELKK